VIQHNKEENLTRCFQIAEEKLGIPKLLEVEDMIRGGSYIDERSVILYSSLFFHAFVADEQRRALAGETTKITSKLQDVQTALEEARARNAELEAELQRVREQEVASNAAKIAELEEKIRQLLEEIKYLRDRSLLELEMRQLLEDKVAALHALIDQTAEERASSDEERAKLRAEIHARAACAISRTARAACWPRSKSCAIALRSRPHAAWRRPPSASASRTRLL
jgi:cortexillin 1/2